MSVITAYNCMHCQQTSCFVLYASTDLNARIGQEYSALSKCDGHQGHRHEDDEIKQLVTFSHET